MRPINGRQIGNVGLRHTCALTVLQATKDLRKVALWLGHAHMQTTEMYTRAYPSVKLEALESMIAQKLRCLDFWQQGGRMGDDWLDELADKANQAAVAADGAQTEYEDTQRRLIPPMESYWATLKEECIRLVKQFNDRTNHRHSARTSYRIRSAYEAYSDDPELSISAVTTLGQTMTTMTVRLAVARRSVHCVQGYLYFDAVFHQSRDGSVLLVRRDSEGRSGAEGPMTAEAFAALIVTGWIHRLLSGHPV